MLARIVQRRLAVAPDMGQDPESPLNYMALATQTEGYSATDLQDLVARAVHQATMRSAEAAARDEDVQVVDLRASSLCRAHRVSLSGRQSSRRPTLRQLKWILLHFPCGISSFRNRMSSGLTLAVNFLVQCLIHLVTYYYH